MSTLKWFELHARMDAGRWLLEELNRCLSKSPIDQMVDDSTVKSSSDLVQARDLLRDIRYCQKKLGIDTKNTDEAMKGVAELLKAKRV